MEAEKSYDLPSVCWRPKKASGSKNWGQGGCPVE